jgi:ankyrin repeat protein
MITTDKFFNTVIQNNIEDIKQYVSYGFDVNREDASGWAALHLASQLGYFEIAKYLIENGATINACNNINSWSALHIACRYAHLNIVNLLIKKGWNINQKEGTSKNPILFSIHFLNSFF